MRNQYRYACRDCGQMVEAGEGYFHKNPRGSFPKWSVRCVLCVAVGKRDRGDSLSDYQRAALVSTGESVRAPQ